MGRHFMQQPHRPCYQDGPPEFISIFHFRCEEWDFMEYKLSCLRGKIINPSLLSLKHLYHLDLSSNDFQGIPIPNFFGELQSLTYLNILHASFGGEIPPSLGNLSNLNYLDLNSDLKYLSSENLNWLSRLSSLNYLNLRNTNLHSTRISWLHSVNMLPSLLELHLSSCEVKILPLQRINLTSLLVLDLSDNQVQTSLFPSWLFNLTSLKKLDLHGNYFGLPLPSEFARLSSLEYLDLSDTGLKFNGQASKLVGNLSKRKFLSLRGNNFERGAIQEFWSSLSDYSNNTLESLDLSYNSLTSQLPGSLGIWLKNLQHLQLQGNSFWGSIPESIGNMSCLKTLNLSNNEMNGSIPESLGQLSELVTLDLRWNLLGEGIITEVHLINLTRLKHLEIHCGELKPLMFNLADHWVAPFRLHSIDIKNCRVGPAFSLWLQSQTELVDVSLYNTGFSDSIPEEWFLKISFRLESLVLCYNQFRGRLPSQLEFPHFDGYIDLSQNQFEGPLPLWSANAGRLDLGSNLFSGRIPLNLSQLMPELRELDLSDNHLDGTIPPSICNIQNLEFLSLRNNNLFGEFPQQWSLWGGIYFIDAAHNNLSGNIPTSMGVPSSLGILHMSHNNLRGEIPASFQNCSYLIIIDLGGNKFTGELPLWVRVGSNVSALRMLNFRSNFLTGHIPQRLCNLRYLHVLDLAHNYFSGTIPTCLNNMTSLVNASFSGGYDPAITTIGGELGYDSNMIHLFKSIDLSSNILHGEIPKEVSSLVELVALNLSMNRLTGEIPSNIGNLRELEILDLADNDLSGDIPQSVSSLTFLSYLNLSYNNLTGKIPSGNQLQTFDSYIYQGNPLLCGAPLSTVCRGEDTPPRPGHILTAQGHNKYDMEMLWLFVSVLLGFVVGFWGVCGALILNRSWRHAYFQFFENIKDEATLAIALKVARWKSSWEQE